MGWGKTKNVEEEGQIRIQGGMILYAGVKPFQGKAF